MAPRSKPKTFADKFEEALAEKRAEDPNFGLRTIARKLADGDPKQAETIRRRLHKYRPKGPGGAAEVAPTEPTRHEIEDALGLERDALEPDAAAVVAHRAITFASLFNESALDEYLTERARVAAERARSELMSA